MNETSIRQLAEAQGRELEAARAAASARTEPTRPELWDAAFPQLIATLDQAARTYCAIYNQAIGFERLICKNDEFAINVESGDHAMRLHFHPTKRRVDDCFTDIDFDRHAFQVTVAVDDQQEEPHLVMYLTSVAVTPEQFMETLLGQFTTELTRVEAEAM